METTELNELKDNLDAKRDMDPIYQIKEKIERLDADRSLKEILWGLVELVEGKADKKHSHFSASETRFRY